jgi:transcriptional regulator with XRE-family HTH domain
MSVAGLWQIEHCQREPSPATIREIAGVLGVPRQQLVENRDAYVKAKKMQSVSVRLRSKPPLPDADRRKPQTRSGGH